MTLADIVKILVIGTIGVIHIAMSYSRPRALGWIVPLLYVGLVASFVYQGAMTSWVDWLMACVGMALLVGFWVSAKRRKLKDEMNRIDNTLSTTASS